MKRLGFLALLLITLTVTSCEKTTDCGCSPVESYPQTYNFQNVDHSGQDDRLDMLSEIMAYVKTSDDGNTISQATLLNMFSNDGYTWEKTELNSSTKQIADKISSDANENIGIWISQLADISKNPGTGSNGTAGLVQNAGGTRQYLMDQNGFHLAEMIEKGVMGALSYYQATGVYLSSSKMDVDNETVETGKGTAMQHHWDEAFGYWGVPNEFGSPGFTYDKTAAYHRFWAKYTNEVNEVLGVNSRLMEAFIKGRTAINNKDYSARDESIANIRNTWEEVCAAMAIHYLNGAKANISDDAMRNHQLSEAAGFIYSLQFNPTTRMGRSEIMNDILPVYLNNLYEVSVGDLNTLRDLIASRYELEQEKENL
ncbi:MAG TPA: DUF4856 domain-containing protein [Cryomorphaceae bacterium]|nr:DUF4856 domain-containing protein [Owenweeksia sp.]MBG00249.1 DUF4856 domain-containing protein [Owenweeksia sp.]HAD96987.1 DUF4856 domain-containing protein [Cryomorphaceae bacterium]HBF19249.1 DUF4856 domain-containing protein [Cryomorphaceae bacterium]HCQ16414.1 DUF4856 domain-containing protein [Cryomorphaceae bacterium]|tara:strand:+ start:305 stop:1411 length:1107 start_codon:yes stop_codon:yes gene_type:complete